MPIRYLTDEDGRRTAVVVELALWEALRERLARLEHDALSVEEAQDAELGWLEYLDGRGRSLDDILAERLENGDG